MKQEHLIDSKPQTAFLLTLQQLQQAQELDWDVNDGQFACVYLQLKQIKLPKNQAICLDKLQLLRPE